MTASAPVAQRRWRLPGIPASPGPVASVDRETMLAADRNATDRFGISLAQMMENAGRELAELARHAVGGSVAGRRVVVLAGTGNNAGGGLVAARRLSGWGADVRVAFAKPILRLRPGARNQLEALLAANVPLAVAGQDRSYQELAGEVLHTDAVIDALIGYSLRGAPDDAFAPLIGLAELGDGPVISLDIPSGIDATTGEQPGAAVSADMTLALALPKRGTEIGAGRDHAGVRYLADIGIPGAVFLELGVESIPDFSMGSLLRLG